MRDFSLAPPTSQRRKTSLKRGVVLISLALALAFLAGCSAVREISDAAQEAQAQAIDAGDHLDAALATGDVGPKAVPHINAAREDLANIHESAGKVINAIPGIQDVTPLWVTVLYWVAVAAAILGVLALLIYLGVGAVARPAFAVFGGWLSWLIPKATAAAAKFDAEAVVAGPISPSHDKSITVSRVGDPGYDLAFTKAKQAAEAAQEAPIGAA